MGVIETVQDAWKDRRRYWDRWGVVRGTWAREQRRGLNGAPAGSLVALRVPDVPWLVWARAGTSDQWVWDQVFLQGELDTALPAAPTTIIDAGANVGYAMLWFAARYPRARIACLEIDPGNIRVLRLNASPVAGRVTVLGKGLWSGRTRLAIENPHAASWSFRARESQDGPIEAIGVDELLDELGFERASLLKLDIEGAELDVLESAHRWIDRVDALMVETHDRYRPGCTDLLAQVARRWGFSVTTTGEYHVLTR